MENIVVDLLRTPELQRLRRIRQLGLVHVVFPGAEHSRFAHSLGCANLAIRFGRHLLEETRDSVIEYFQPKEAAIRDLAVAALCHDLGHGALSHTWEREIIGEGEVIIQGWAAHFGIGLEPQEVKRLKWHELVTHAILKWPEGQLHKILERDEDRFTERISLMLRGKHFIPYLPRLLSSDVDIDRADFILRDAHQSGVAYGKYDLNWLLSTCTIGETSNRELVVGFDEAKSLRVVEQFLVARRSLYRTVYLHKAVRSAEGMVALFLGRLKQVLQATPDLPTPSFVRPVVEMIAGKKVSISDLLSVDDFSLWVLIESISKSDRIDETVQDLAQRIVTRDLFKCVPVTWEHAAEFMTRPDAYQRLYDVVGKYSGINPESYVFVDRPKFKMFETVDSKASYFITADGKAKLVRDNELLKHNSLPESEAVRIFTLERAVSAVRALIET